MDEERRRTYVVSVRDRHGPATIEEVHSGRRARLDTYEDAPRQIGLWLSERAADTGRAAGRADGSAESR